MTDYIDFGFVGNSVIQTQTPCGGQVFVFRQAFSVPVPVVTFWEEWHMVIAVSAVVAYLLVGAFTAYKAGKVCGDSVTPIPILWPLFWPIGWIVYGFVLAFNAGRDSTKDGYRMSIGGK